MSNDPIYIDESGRFHQPDPYRMAGMGLPSGWREPTPFELAMHREIKELKEQVAQLWYHINTNGRNP